MGGTYPLMTPRNTHPKGIATAQPGTTCRTVAHAKFCVLLFSSVDRYTPVKGDVANQASKKGKAVVKTAAQSKVPSAGLCYALPTAAKPTKAAASTTANSGRSNGVDRLETGSSLSLRISAPRGERV